MQLVTNPHLEAGKESVMRLRERNFTGYIRSCIEELLAGTDAGRYSFHDLGTTETEVLDLAIHHVGQDLLRGLQYPFAYLKLKNDLLCRKSRVLGAHVLPPEMRVVVPFERQMEERKAA